MNQTKMEVKEDNNSNKDEHFINVQAKIARINHFLVDGKRVPFPPELKFYYGYFYTWAIQVKKVCPSKELIAEQTGESKPTAMKRINALVDLGLLRIEVEGRKHVYHLTMPDEVIKMAYGTITAKTDSKKPKAVKTVTPQEPQQPEINPALPSSDDIHTSADSGSDDSQDEQQTESPPDTRTEEITKPVPVYPWGSSGAFNPNGSVTEPAKQWALSKTGGNVYHAERYLIDYLRQLLNKPITLSFDEEEESEELPF